MELELEGFTSSSQQMLARHVDPQWRVTGDGSLRNGGIELITNGGIGGQRLVDAFERLASGLERVNYDASFRCSSHMHINMLDFTINQVVRFMLVYTACEPIIFTFCGAYRESSNFCTPVTASLPFHRKLISKLFDNAISQRTAVQSTSKYTALNLAPLFPNDRGVALGTVEFRGGRPITSVDDMILQANLLLAIKQYVRTFQGDEDALLASLSTGLHNTVYNMGITAGINTNADRLENALIHSWCLLKSYQESMRRETLRRAGRGATAEDDEGEDRPRARPSNNFFNHGQGATLEVTHFDEVETRPSRGVDLQSIDDLHHYGLETWTGVTRHWALLNNPRSPNTQMDAYWSAAGNKLNPTDRVNIATNFIGQKTLTSATDHAPNKLVNLMVQTVHDAGGGTLRVTTMQPYFLNPVSADYRVDGKADYSRSPDLMRNLIRVLQKTASATVGQIWMDLVGRQVRIKQRQTLVNLANDRGFSRISNLLMRNETIPASKAYAIFRMLDVASIDHVHAGSLNQYDMVAAAMRYLAEQNMSAPAVVTTGSSTRLTRFLRANGTMAMGEPGSVGNQSHTPRLNTEIHELIY